MRTPWCPRVPAPSVESTAIVAARAQQEDHMKTRLAVLGALTAAAAALAAPAYADDLSPETLLERYQPVVVLSQGELYAPTTVEDFLADADLRQLGAGGTFQHVDMPPA